MRILLTGGSGDLGGLLSEALAAQGDEPAVIELAPPHPCVKTYFGASILDRVAVGKAVESMACVIHIAAWHGIHETRRTKTVYEFHDLNVTGTFNVPEAAAGAGVKRFLFISSTSVADRYGVYGHSKILGEEMSRAYAHRHGMEVIILRAVLCAVELLKNGRLAPPALIYTIDGAFDFTTEDLDTWDADAPGSTFRKYYPEDEDLLRKYGLDPARKPKVLNIPDAEKLPGYAPQYSLKKMLEELRRSDAGTGGAAGVI